MNNFFPTIYAPVKVSERLPEIEIWQDVEGYKDRYQVSSHGRIRSVNIKGNGKIRILKGSTCGLRKYIKIRLWDLNRSTKQFLVHRLVAKAFIANPEGKPFINHIDNNVSNNHVSNLEWCTNTENLAHSVRQGRLHQGINCYSAKLTEDDVRNIIKMRLQQKQTIPFISKKYKVSEVTIWEIVSGRSWKHLKSQS